VSCLKRILPYLVSDPIFQSHMVFWNVFSKTLLLTCFQILSSKATWDFESYLLKSGDISDPIFLFAIFWKIRLHLYKDTLEVIISSTLGHKCRAFLDEFFSSHPLCFFSTPFFYFCPCIKTSECVFRSFLVQIRKTYFKVFSKTKIIWKTHCKIFIQGQKWKSGRRKETQRVGREKFFLGFLEAMSNIESLKAIFLNNIYM
jgi:hypothetical protein